MEEEELTRHSCATLQHGIVNVVYSCRKESGVVSGPNKNRNKFTDADPNKVPSNVNIPTGLLFMLQNSRRVGGWKAGVT